MRVLPPCRGDRLTITRYAHLAQEVKTLYSISRSYGQFLTNAAVIGCTYSLVAQVARGWDGEGALEVDVTERSCSGAQQVLDLKWRASGKANVDEVVDGGVGAGRVVQERPGAGDRRGPLGAVLGRQKLPNPPDAVDHGVVEVEGRVAGGHEEVAAGIASHGVVATAVDADVSRPWDSLHLHLE